LKCTYVARAAEISIRIAPSTERSRHQPAKQLLNKSDFLCAAGSRTVPDVVRGAENKGASGDASPSAVSGGGSSSEGRRGGSSPLFSMAPF